jgi:hypothetical protein
MFASWEADGLGNAGPTYCILLRPTFNHGPSSGLFWSCCGPLWDEVVEKWMKGERVKSTDEK